MTKSPLNIPVDKLPRHVAIIMDGNGRWALSRGLPRLAGHKAGTENLRRIIRASVEFGVKYLTIYAFSTENGDINYGDYRAPVVPGGDTHHTSVVAH